MAKFAAAAIVGGVAAEVGPGSEGVAGAAIIQNPGRASTRAPSPNTAWGSGAEVGGLCDRLGFLLGVIMGLNGVIYRLWRRKWKLL